MANALTSIHGRRLGLRNDGSLQTEGGVLKVPSYATTDLPDATDHEGAIAYDLTLNTLVYSNGTAWQSLTEAAG